MANDIKRIHGKACVSSALLTEYFGVTKQALSKWGKQGCPKEERGYWCVADVLLWRGESAVSVGDEVEKRPLKEQKMYWETRCREEQAENQKFKNAVLRGDYLEKNKMNRELLAFFTVFKQAVFSLPRKAAITAAQYIGNERARKLETDMMEVMNDALEEWSNGNCVVDSGINGGVKTPGKNNGDAVGGSKSRARRKKQQ